MAKILGMVFNRWTLLALLLLVLLVLVWVIGPVVAIGEWHPLDTLNARWATTGVVLALVAIGIGWRLWAARRGNQQVVAQLAAAPAGPAAAAETADMAAVRERFTTAMQTLRKARFSAPGGATGAKGWLANLTRKLSGRYLYELPWYLIVGAPGSGKTTALRNAGLQFPLAAQMGDLAVRGVGGTRSCDWWFTDQAVLVDTAGRFTTQDSDAATDKGTWTGFLALLKKSRPRQPLNGVLVTVSVSDLLLKSDAERERYAQLVTLRLQELQQTLAVRLPVYLLVTKCDLMAGFAESFEAMDKARRAIPWGYALDRAQPAGWQAVLESEFDLLLGRLNDGLVDTLAAEADLPRRQRIYGFPNQFATLRTPLHDFVRQVFSKSPTATDPSLRGVYFVSGTQEGTPIDRVLGAVARRYRLDSQAQDAQQGTGRSYFLQRLLTEVVFAEQGLAGSDRRWEQRRRVAALAGYALVGTLTATALVAWTLSWRNNRVYIDEVAARAAQVSRQVQETPNRASPDLLPLVPALEATRSLAATGAAAAAGGSVPWSMGFGLYQGRKLDGAARAAYERMLPDAVLPRLALRVEEQLRNNDHPESQYEALKAYLMMYDVRHFDAASLKAHIEADWDRAGRGLAPEQRDALSRQLDALLAQGPAVSPLPQDAALVAATRERLARVPLPERVYNRLRQRGLGAEFPEFTVAKAGGINAPLVFVRAKGAPLTRGVPGLYTYKGYHQGFQKEVGEVTRQLADEQGWVLGLPASSAPVASAALVDDVRRLYLNDYRDTWKDFIADIKLQPVGSIAQSLERTRFLAAPDSPLVPLVKAMARETTLLAPDGVLDKAAGSARGVVEQATGKVLGALGAKPTALSPTTGAPTVRIESIVDDEFAKLRYLATAPEGGKAPVEAVVARLGELQVLLTSVDSALKGGAAPPPSPLPNQLKVEAANAPEPVRSLLDSLGTTTSRVAQLQLRESLSREVRSQVGEFCAQAIQGRYPFDPSAGQDVTPADFTALFGPGGKFEQMQTKLAPYIDTSTRPWSFRAVEGTPLGADSGTLPQFQRAAVIRDTFFSGGAGPGTRLDFKPVEMDASLRVFTLDVDGQTVRYDHGPQLSQPVKWPGPRGANQVRVLLEPAGAGSNGLLNDGPWALFRLFDRVSLQPQAAPEKYRAIFDIDGRKAVFEVTASSVRNPLRLPELRAFRCPQGL